MPNPAVQPLFDEARKLGVGFHLGYAELTHEEGRQRRFNTAILVAPNGATVGKYRKIHLPGHADHRPHLPFQHLEKRYFDVGNGGFQVYRAFNGIIGMCICNDRRWPETFRVMGLQGVDMVVLGFNTPDTNIYHPEPVHRRMFHHMLSLQAGAYQNATWVVASAKAGKEDGFGLIGGSAIVAPTGEIAAQSITEDDELIMFNCDLDMGRDFKDHIFNFEKHRRIEHYKLITEQTGVVYPPEE
jgi:predicted amidohydrolase